MAGAVPGRVTEMPATAEPKRTASTGAVPRDRAAAKPPLKASLPRRVDHLAGLEGGTSTDSFLVWYSAPCEPSVMIAVLTPIARSLSAAARASSTVVTGRRSGFPLALIRRDIVAEREDGGVERLRRRRIEDRRRPTRFGDLKRPDRSVERLFELGHEDLRLADQIG